MKKTIKIFGLLGIGLMFVVVFDYWRRRLCQKTPELNVNKNPMPTETEQPAIMSDGLIDPYQTPDFVENPHQGIAMQTNLLPGSMEAFIR